MSVYFFLPGAFANMAPVFSKNILKWMAKPVDFGFKVRGKPLFGKNKTFRGFFVGFVYALIVVWVQKWLFLDYPIMREIAVIDYSAINIFMLAFLMSFGVLIGDAAESFFKRQRGVEPGRSWFPFDQLDFVFGFLIFTLWTVPWLVNKWYVALILVITIPIFHVIFNIFGKLLKLKKTWI